MRRTLLLIPLMLLGCEADSPCDPGQKLEQGACASPMSPMVTTDAAAEEDAATCAEKVEDVIGGECATEADCSCGAPFCAVPPTGDPGTCTITGCSTENGGSGCPTGYSCFDVSIFGVQGQDPFCVKG